MALTPLPSIGPVAKIRNAVVRDRPPVGSLQQAKAAQLIQVTANRLRCDAKALSQDVDYDITVGPGVAQDGLLALAQLGTLRLHGGVGV